MKSFLVRIFLKFIRGGYCKYFRNKNNIILIYTMGKVGSSTVYATLAKNLPGLDVFHVHFLSSHWLNDVLPNEHEHFHSNIKAGKKILDHIKKNPHKRVKIITLVREPVEREISDIFQNPISFFDSDDINSVDAEKVMSNIVKNNFSYPVDWFDTEFKNYTGVDIFSLNFDKIKGYGIYNGDKTDILCIKLEKLSDCFKGAFKEFLGLKLLKLETSNETKDRSSYLKYKEVKKIVKMSNEKLNSIYNSGYSKHFYTDDEILTFVGQWSL